VAVGRECWPDGALRYMVAKPLVKAHAAFLEVDRGTIDPQELARQLGRYCRLYGVRSSWRSQYDRFPLVLVVFDANHRSTRDRTEDRMATVVSLVRGDAELMRLAKAGEVRVCFTLLEDLQRRGPFAPIWAPLAAPERLVGWLEEDEPTGLRVVRDRGEGDE
jgi:hypothetical protein